MRTVTEPLKQAVASRRKYNEDIWEANLGLGLVGQSRQALDLTFVEIATAPVHLEEYLNIFTNRPVKDQHIGTKAPACVLRSTDEDALL